MVKLSLVGEAAQEAPILVPFMLLPVFHCLGVECHFISEKTRFTAVRMPVALPCRQHEMDVRFSFRSCLLRRNYINHGISLDCIQWYTEIPRFTKVQGFISIL